MVVRFFRVRQYAGFVFRLLIASSCALPVLARDGPPADPGSTAILRDGSMQSLELVGTTAAGDWIFDAASQRVTVANDQLIVWGACEERGQRTWVLLTDGSLIVSDLLAIEKEALVLTGRIWPETRVARQHVRAILFRQPMDCLARDLLYHRAIFQERDEDQLLLDNGDELKGAMPDEVRPEPGAFHPERIRWPMRGTVEGVEMPLERVTALLFAGGKDSSLARHGTTWLGLNDGSRLLATRFTHHGKTLSFELSAGVRLVTDAGAFPEGNPLSAVVLIQPMTREVTYVSDLEPLGYRHIPFLSTSWPYQNDRSASGGQLRYAGHAYLKGIGMHSSSRLAYDLGGRFQTLQAELAVDQRAGRSGSVEFRVYLQDSDGQWSRAYESDVVRGGDPLMPMRVNVRARTASP